MGFCHALSPSPFPHQQGPPSVPPGKKTELECGGASWPGDLSQEATDISPGLRDSAAG